MNTVRIIVKNAGVLIISQIVSKILGFFYIMYTARYLGVEGFGILSFVLAFTGIFGIFTDFGLSQLTVREVARDKSLANKYLNNITAIKIILVIITFGLIVLVINILGYPEQTIKVVYLISLSIVFSAFTRMFYSIFQAFEKMEYQSLGQILNSVSMFFGVILAIKCNFTIIGFAFLYLIASFITLGFSLAILRWKFSNPFFIWSPRNIEIDWNFMKPMISEALPFGLSGFFVIIYFYIDSVMLSLMQSDIAVGFYSAGYRMVLVLLFIRTSLHMSIFPVMSQFYKTSKDFLRITCEQLFKFSLIIIFPIAIGTTLLARRFVLLIYGTEYLPSVPALQILIWFSVFIFANFITRLFEAINKQLVIVKITAFGAATNVILNLLLIPKYSFIGAALTTCFTELLVLCISFVIFSKTEYKFNVSFIFYVLLKTIVAAIIMGVFIMFFYNLNIFILVFSSALIYVALLCIMHMFNNAEITMVKKLIKGKNI
jgi:O-antigen/teichoic acid export membrane protein